MPADLAAWSDLGARRVLARLRVATTRVEPPARLEPNRLARPLGQLAIQPASAFTVIGACLALCLLVRAHFNGRVWGRASQPAGQRQRDLADVLRAPGEVAPAHLHDNAAQSGRPQSQAEFPLTSTRSLDS